jgi:sensor histidine kinase YesM
MEPPYRLDLYIHKEQRGWGIAVADNGPGVSPETAREIIEKTTVFDREHLGKMHIGGIGLVSAVLRLRLLTGQKTELFMDSNTPRGTVVKLLIPARKVREDVKYSL